MRGYISLDKYPSCINSHIKNTPLLLGEDKRWRIMRGDVPRQVSKKVY